MIPVSVYYQFFLSRYRGIKKTREMTNFPSVIYGTESKLAWRNDSSQDIFGWRRAIFKTYAFRNRRAASIIDRSVRRGERKKESEAAAESGEHARGANLYIFNESTQL